MIHEGVEAPAVTNPCSGRSDGGGSGGVTRGGDDFFVTDADARETHVRLPWKPTASAAAAEVERDAGGGGGGGVVSRSVQHVSIFPRAQKIDGSKDGWRTRRESNCAGRKCPRSRQAVVVIRLNCKSVGVAVP